MFEIPAGVPAAPGCVATALDCPAANQEPPEEPEDRAMTPEPAVIGREDRSGHLRRRSEA